MADTSRERYRLERKISGKGGFGDVWLATDTLLDRPVAIKCPKATDDPIRRERFLVEARMLACLNHPNITQIHDAFFDEGEGNLYLVMEYVDGRDLSDIIRSGTPLPLDITLEVAMGILRALSYAHQQGIVHRDVKPANVMIADDVKLTDFGLANLRSILGRGSGFMAGTPAYMAPEQIEGQATDGRADLYALGVILFEMLSSGRLPFEYADEVKMMDAHLHAAPPPISQFARPVPPALEQVVMRLLAKDPEERYPSAEAVIEVLESIHVGPKLTNLPVPLIPFVGREAELAEIRDRLGDPACRLLTLVGPGGCGKTRLALEAATAQIENYPHGVFFVSLAPIDSVDSIVPTVAEALGFCFYEEGEPQQQLLDYLRGKTMLLIMDNFEHLVEGVGLVTEILRTAPDIRVLTTSRARLNVKGEHLLPIAGMGFPDEETAEEVVLSLSKVAGQYSAVKLFLQSAHRVQPSFEPTADDLFEVGRICRLAEGMPLGILLAAAWMEMLTPAEIAAEVGQSLDFLETDLRDLPKRQRSLRAVFDHSWKLLAEREREVFQGLSVFRGGFTRDAARKVTDASLRDLMSLVNKSLLHRTSRGRYGVHELLRGYAAEKLGQSPSASEVMRDRHCAYYAAAFQRWGEELIGSRQQKAVAEMDAEISNARAAWNWSTEQGQVERLDQAIDGLCRFYEWRGRYREGEAVCRMPAKKLATTASGDDLRIWAKILTWQSVFSQALGHPEQASHLLQRSLVLLERPELAGQDIRPERALVLLERGWIVYGSDREKAKRLYDQSLALFRTLDNQWGIAQALFALGEVSRYLGAYEDAKRFHEEGLAIRRTMGDRRGIAASLGGLSAIAVYQGQLEEGKQLIRQSITIRREIDDRPGIADALYDLGVTHNFLGEYAEALTQLEESVALYHDLGVRDRLARGSVTQAFTRMHLGRYEEARVQVQMGLSLSRETGHQYGIASGLGTLGGVALAEGKYAEARRRSQEAVVIFQEIGQRDELGWALVVLGSAELGLGNLPRARHLYYEALQLAAEVRSFMTLLLVMSGIALLVAAAGEKEWAVELFSLASRYPAIANSQSMADIAGRHIAAVASSLPPEVVAAAQGSGRARDLEATVTELLAESEC